MLDLAKSRDTHTVMSPVLSAHRVCQQLSSVQGNEEGQVDCSILRCPEAALPTPTHCSIYNVRTTRPSTAPLKSCTQALPSRAPGLLLRDMLSKYSLMPRP